MTINKPFLLFVFLIGLLPTLLHAQVFSNRRGGGNGFEQSSTQIVVDSSKKLQRSTNDSLAIFSVGLNDSITCKPDSSIINQHRNPYLSIWDRDLGNLGTAYYSLCFNPDMNPAMQLGMQHNQAYLYKPEQLRFYNTTRPYTDIFYSMGTKQEQLIRVLHTQNIRPNWNMAAGYTKLVSPGNFKFLRSNHDLGFVNSYFHSKNLRYQQKAALTYNKLQQDENGGIRNEQDLLNPIYNDRRLIPVTFSPSSFSANRSAVLNYYRNVSLVLNHQYYLGKTEKNMGKDSLIHPKTFIPQFGIKHRFYSNFIYQYYEDQQPDSSYYGYLYNVDEANPDSLYHKHFVSQIGNSLSLNKPIRIQHKAAELEAGYGAEWERVVNRQGHFTYINNYVFGELLKAQHDQERWQYQGSVKLYFTGNASGNFLFNAKLGRLISKKLGSLNVQFAQSLQSPDYRTGYYYRPFSDSIPLLKPAISKLSGSYSNPAWRLNINFTQYSVTNYIYIDSLAKVQQHKPALFVTQLHVDKEFRWRSWHWANSVLVQLSEDSTPIHLPRFAGCSKLYYENAVVKSKLNIATGIECRYVMPYLNDDYLPIFQSFSVQYQRKIENIPVFSYFFNFKIKKRFRAAISLDELQQLYADNNLNATNYPTPNFMMRFRLNWVFVN